MQRTAWQDTSLARPSSRALSRWKTAPSGLITYLANIDYVRGSGAYTLYQTVKFPDGSSLRMKAGSPAKLDGSKTDFPDGKITVLGGEGRYAGASGDGEYVGTRLAPIADGGDTLEQGVIRLK